jgi:hypothetical protein
VACLGRLLPAPRSPSSSFSRGLCARHHCPVSHASTPIFLLPLPLGSASMFLTASDLYFYCVFAFGADPGDCTLDAPPPSPLHLFPPSALLCSSPRTSPPKPHGLRYPSVAAHVASRLPCDLRPHARPPWSAVPASPPPPPTVILSASSVITPCFVFFQDIVIPRCFSTSFFAFYRNTNVAVGCAFSSPMTPDPLTYILACALTFSKYQPLSRSSPASMCLVRRRGCLGARPSPPLPSPFPLLPAHPPIPPPPSSPLFRHVHADLVFL